MMRALIMVFLLGAGSVFSQSLDNLYTSGDGEVNISFQSTALAGGTVDLYWTLAQNSTRISPTQYVAVGLQNGNAANASAADTSMFGPSGGGSEFFFIYGAASMATGLHRYLNNSERAGRPGAAPVGIQRTTSSGTPGSSDRIRNVSVSTVNGETMFKMTVTCGTNFWTDLSSPSSVLWARGTIDGNGEPMNHGGGNRGWRRVSDTGGNLLMFTMCGPTAGLSFDPTAGPISTTVPAVTTGSKASVAAPLSMLTSLFAVTSLLVGAF